MDEQIVSKTLENLRKNKFKAEFFSSAQDAKAAALGMIGAGETVGIGGSVTIQSLELDKELLQKGHSVYWHWLVPPAERDEARAKAAAADVYLASTNALTEAGELVNIDGTGNRVSSMFYGPKKVIIICGWNKITKDYDTAIDRIKTQACPANARRLKLNTPCAVTGKCNDCSSAQRMCNITVKLERPPHGKDIHIFLVGEELGY